MEVSVNKIIALKVKVMIR